MRKRSSGDDEAVRSVADPARSDAPRPTGGDSIPIELPRLSADASAEDGSATLAAWLVAVGDLVEKGAIVAEIETDKATLELEAPAPGRIESLLVAAGSEGLKPGTLLGRIAPVAQASASARSSSQPASSPAIRPVRADGESSEGRSAGSETSGARSAATPLARRLAATRGVDLEQVVGTGVGGRIGKADVERTVQPAAATAATAAAVASVGAVASVVAPARPAAPLAPASGPRPGVQLTLRAHVDAIAAARARLEVESGDRKRITLNDFVVRATALALRDVPGANRNGTRGDVEARAAVDVGLVVAREGGSAVVVVCDADRKGLSVLSDEIRSQVEQARGENAEARPEGKPALLITSFARFGIESAHPMLPMDQDCVLAVGALAREPVVRDAQVVIGSRLSLTLVFDPGVFGGAVMAELLSAIRNRLEDPLGMML